MGRITLVSWIVGLIATGIAWGLWGVTGAIAICIATLIAIWFVAWIKILGPKEMGEKIVFGDAVSFCDSGLTLVPALPGCEIAKFPKDVFQVTYKPFKVITKEDEYKGEHYKAQPVVIETATYFPLSRTHQDLKKFLEAGVKPTEDAIREFFTEEVQTDYRIAMADLTWREATEIEGRKKIFDRVKQLITEENSAFMKAGIEAEKIRILLNEITLDKKIEERLSEPDQRKIEAEAAKHKAKGREEEVAIIGTMKKRLEADGIPSDRAAEMAFERDGDHVAGDKGELKKIKIEGLGGGSSIAGIMAEMELIKQMMAGARESPKGEEEKPEEGEGELSPNASPDEIMKRFEKAVKKIKG